MAEQTKFHPALAVNNIKNFIPITLQMENDQYSSWAELFKIHCRVYKVLHHILPPNPKPIDKNIETTDDSDKELWLRLDAVVLQWIYGTISNDLLHAIIETDATAQQTWERLETIFHDNKNHCALYLENQFKNIHQDAFPNASAYCQKLKMLADQLSNVGTPVSNQQLVLQLIQGLSDDYDGVAAILQQSHSLPPFDEACSRLILEETIKVKRGATATSIADAALLNIGNSADDIRGSHSGQNHNTNGQKHGQYRGNNKGRNNVGRGCGGRSGHTQASGANNQPPPLQKQQHYPHEWAYYPPWASWASSQWAIPPCPYPMPSWARPPIARQPSILGSRPPQAYVPQVLPPSSYASTDTEAAVHTMTLNAPNENWYMDIGATSHMTTSPGHSDGDANHKM